MSKTSMTFCNKEGRPVPVRIDMDGPINELVDLQDAVLDHMKARGYYLKGR